MEGRTHRWRLWLRTTIREQTTQEGKIMWDTAETNDVHLSHDMRCTRCGHDLHTFLACGTHCACEPVVMPGAAV